jgi:hypothetical protein
MKINDNVKHDRLNTNHITNIVNRLVFKINLLSLLTSWHSLFSHMRYLATNFVVRFC